MHGAALVSSDLDVLVQQQQTTALQQLLCSAVFTIWHSWAGSRAATRSRYHNTKQGLSGLRRRQVLTAWHALAAERTALHAKEIALHQWQQLRLVTQAYREWRVHHTGSRVAKARQAVAVLWHARITCAKAVTAWAGATRRAGIIKAAIENSGSGGSSKTGAKASGSKSGSGRFLSCSRSLKAAIQQQIAWKVSALAAVAASKVQHLEALAAAEPGSVSGNSKLPTAAEVVALLQQQWQQDRQQRAAVQVKLLQQQELWELQAKQAVVAVPDDLLSCPSQRGIGSSESSDWYLSAEPSMHGQAARLQLAQGTALATAQNAAAGGCDIFTASSPGHKLKWQQQIMQQQQQPEHDQTCQCKLPDHHDWQLFHTHRQQLQPHSPVALQGSHSRSPDRARPAVLCQCSSTATQPGLNCSSCASQQAPGSAEGLAVMKSAVEAGSPSQAAAPAFVSLRATGSGVKHLHHTAEEKQSSTRQMEAAGRPKQASFCEDGSAAADRLASTTNSTSAVNMCCKPPQQQQLQQGQLAQAAFTWHGQLGSHEDNSSSSDNCSCIVAQIRSGAANVGASVLASAVNVVNSEPGQRALGMPISNTGAEGAARLASAKQLLLSISNRHHSVPGNKCSTFQRQAATETGAANPCTAAVIGAGSGTLHSIWSGGASGDNAEVTGSGLSCDYNCGDFASPGCVVDAPQPELLYDDAMAKVSRRASATDPADTGLEGYDMTAEVAACAAIAAPAAAEGRQEQAGKEILTEGCLAVREAGIGTVEGHSSSSSSSGNISCDADDDCSSAVPLHPHCQHCIALSGHRRASQAVENYSSWVLCRKALQGFGVLLQQAQQLEGAATAHWQRGLQHRVVGLWAEEAQQQHCLVTAAALRLVAKGQVGDEQGRECGVCMA